MLSSDAFLCGRRGQIAALATRYAVPARYGSLRTWLDLRLCPTQSRLTRNGSGYAILSTKGMRQPVCSRGGKPSDKEGLPSRFGFVDTGELALYAAEHNKRQCGEFD